LYGIVSHPQRAGIVRLAAASRIEDGGVEQDPAVNVIDVDDRGRDLPSIGVSRVDVPSHEATVATPGSPCSDTLPAFSGP
jgi:hypothetical protein